MNTTTREKTIKELFVGECWKYLRVNFRKFSEPNKIKIALELCKKDIPQELTGDFQHKVTELALIRKEIPSGELNTEPVNRIADYLIGSPPSSSNTEYSQ